MHLQQKEQRMNLDASVVRSDLPESLSHEKAQHLKTEAVWSHLSEITVAASIILWLETFKPSTRENYFSGMNRLAQLGFLYPEENLQVFSLKNHESVVDRIKQVPNWTEATKQAHAACYISFTGFLARRSEGVIWVGLFSSCVISTVPIGDALLGCG